MSNLLRWELWLKGLVAAVIQGATSSICAMVIAPETFNVNELKKIGQLALVSGIMGAAMYLKQSPLPRMDEEEQVKKP